MYHYKLALPATCPTGLIGLALGERAKDGRLASFVLGFSVILVYYILCAARGRLPWADSSTRVWPHGFPTSSGIAAIVMLVWRSRSTDRPIPFQCSGILGETERRFRRFRRRQHPPARRRAVIVLRLPRLNLPRPRLPDIYVSREYLRVFLLAVLSLLGIFYISTFIDLADKLFRGSADPHAARLLLLSDSAVCLLRDSDGVLVATLVTLGILTKNSEIW